jgi:hypothetical protein
MIEGFKTDAVHGETPEQKETARQKFLENFAGYGLSRADGHIVFDLIIAGKGEIFDKAKEISERAPPHLKDLTMCSLLQHTEASLTAMNDLMALMSVIALKRARLG